MTYDGPPEKFPKSGYCPRCDPANAGLLLEEQAVLASFQQSDDALWETTVQAAIDNEIQIMAG
jgi:hypothetical protein